MVDLMTIQDSVQQIANAISTVFKMDVEVINNKYCRVAGTGKYANNLGQEIKSNYVYQKVIANQLDILISNPKENDFCLPCPEKILCLEYAELCSPIFLNNCVIGVFGLIAFNEKQRDILINSQNELLSFIQQMGRMLAAKVHEEEFVRELKLEREQLEAVINSVSEGILSFDTSETITHCNNSAASMLGITKENIVGRNISEIIADHKLLNVLKTGIGYTDKEIYHNNLKELSLGTAEPVIDEKKNIVGVVTSFRPIEQVNRLIFDYTMKQIDISIHTIIGVSQKMVDLRESITKFAKSNSTVLICGESGTGKEIFARAIHSLSQRKNKPFIAINCSAIPDTLLESELFGYDEGAFTGAKRRGKPGKFEIADGGTVFLDEIGDMPIHLQVKILRTLQERVIERVGGNTIIHVNIRFIAATNRPLEEMIARGEFREDLYYRLNVIPLFIPPLRERLEDILPLLKHFTTKYNRLFGKTIKEFSNQAVAAILAYEWPGNVRELENAVEYAFNIETSSSIQMESLPIKLQKKNSEPIASPTIMSLKDMEKAAFRQAIKYFGSSLEGKKLAAEALGVGIATFYRKLKYYNI